MRIGTAASRHNVKPPPATESVRTTLSQHSQMGDNLPVLLGNAASELSPKPKYAEQRIQLQPNEGKANIKVCVRLRPLIASASSNVESHATHWTSTCTVSVVRNPNKESQVYAFDHVFDTESTQDTVYNVVGKPIIQGVLDGFHGCVFAYGQTGSGKSYTIFGGLNSHRGLLPRIAESLFTDLQKEHAQCSAKLSYCELYNEHARDLLRPNVGTNGAAGESLRIREHPRVGVFLEGLTNNVVKSARDVLRLLDLGHKFRTVGCNNMNAVSSRSHAIVTLNVERVIRQEHAESIKRRSQLHVVDLAGSERTYQAGESEIRLKESKYINSSLSALSLQISRLADRERRAKRGEPQDAMHIPYRSSKLTHILANSLTGNCRTVMIACASPSVSALGMTESTLRFASSVKQIRTRPVQNVELDGELIEQLRDEIKMLRAQILDSKLEASKKSCIRSSIQLSESLCAQLEADQSEQTTWDEDRCHALANLGLDSSSLVSLAQGRCDNRAKSDADPYLVNDCEDTLLAGCLVYSLSPGKIVRIGSGDDCVIRIYGLGVQPEMCSLTSQDGKHVQISTNSDNPLLDQSSPSSSQGQRRSLRKHRNAAVVTSLYKSAFPDVFVNNERLFGRRDLKSGDTLRLGLTHKFRLIIPRSRTSAEQSWSGLLEELSKGKTTIEQHLTKEYASHLRDRIGVERTLRICSALYELQGLVEEANEITGELRGGECRELEFKAHVLADIGDGDNDPDLAITLRSIENPDEIDAGGNALYNNDVQDSSLIAIFSDEQFRCRLEVMRSLYDEVCHRDQPWNELKDPNPWERNFVDHLHGDFEDAHHKCGNSSQIHRIIKFLDYEALHNSDDDAMVDIKVPKRVAERLLKLCSASLAPDSDSPEQPKGQKETAVLDRVFLPGKTNQEDVVDGFVTRTRSRSPGMKRISKQSLDETLERPQTLSQPEPATAIPDDMKAKVCDIIETLKTAQQHLSYYMRDDQHRSRIASVDPSSKQVCSSGRCTPVMSRSPSPTQRYVMASNAMGGRHDNSACGYPVYKDIPYFSKNLVARTVGPWRPDYLISQSSSYTVRYM